MKSRRLAKALVLLVPLLCCTACVSARYQKAHADTPPAVILNLKATEPPAEVTLHSVIIYQGPGSWKREAFWDEYVISIANHGTTPLEVESAALVDFCGESTEPGDHPWHLEKESLSRREQLSRGEKATLIQIGGGFATAGVGGPLLATSLLSSTAAVGSFDLAIACVAVVPFYVGGAVYRNVSSRRDIQAVFARRRLVLPAIVAPGQVVLGSLFFRLAPGPQRLEVSIRKAEAVRDVVVDLRPLSGLHLVASDPIKNQPLAGSNQYATP